MVLIHIKKRLADIGAIRFNSVKYKKWTFGYEATLYEIRLLADLA